jgi:hypothetical protein
MTVPKWWAQMPANSQAKSMRPGGEFCCSTNERYRNADGGGFVIVGANLGPNAHRFPFGSAVNRR